MIQVAKIIGASLATIGLVGAGMEIGVVLGALVRRCRLIILNNHRIVSDLPISLPATELRKEKPRPNIASLSKGSRTKPN